MPARPASFAEVVAQLDYAVFIVTTAAPGQRAGCLIGFASQVSIHPPRFLACLSVKNRTYRVSRDAKVLAVHFVSEEDVELAELFGGETGDELDKFERCEWHPGPDGVPILSAPRNWFAGEIIRRLDFGDHCGLLLDPIEGQAGRAPSALTFHRSKWIEPGHEP